VFFFYEKVAIFFYLDLRYYECELIMDDRTIKNMVRIKGIRYEN